MQRSPDHERENITAYMVTHNEISYAFHKEKALGNWNNYRSAFMTCINLISCY